ncbi:ABC transporter ATP-binding protein [alpha proteobacterium AAP81b]|nr:ABC transporter ATP-binding protein [alpha proteobacterium AAP81b]
MADVSPLLVTGLAKAVPGRSLFARLDLALAPGEVVAIMGESGVGKSTLLNLIAGLDTADAGSIVIAGEDLARLDDDARTRLRRRAIGFVFQAFHILPHLDLAHNVALPLALLGADGLGEAEAMLARVGLGGRGKALPAVLSGGELQRVAIARALVHRPALILADEPTGNLDPETADRILALLIGAAHDSGAAAIIVTHSDRAAAACDRVLRLGAGGLQPHG